MTQYEYKVIAAPTKGRKSPGVKTAEARFAFAIEELMNEMAAEGWAYLRSDLLPNEERQGLTSSQTVYRSVLVFQRPAGASHDTSGQSPEGETLTATPPTAPRVAPPSATETAPTAEPPLSRTPQPQDDTSEDPPKPA